MTTSQIVITVLFWVAECIAFPIFIKAQWPKSNYVSFVTKMISASIFVGYGVYLASITGWNSMFTRFMVIGFVGGWLGDLLLHLDPFLGENKVGKEASFVAGLFAFLSGHVMYVTAYVNGINALGYKIGWVTYALITVIIAAAVIISVATKLKLGIAAVPVALYALTISTMLGMAITLGVNVFSVSPLVSLALIAGAILFVISDGTLVFCIFGSEKAKTNFLLKVVNLATYFIAQMLLGSSIFLMAYLIAKLRQIC